MDWIAKWESIARNRVHAKAPASVPTRHAREVPGHYASLFRYLEGRYANITVLTLRQIEDLLGFALPDCARTDHEWWTMADRRDGTPPYSDTWTLAGWTARPNLLAQNVLFERTGKA